MKLLLATLFGFLFVVPPHAPVAPDATLLKGDYLEARTCDVWVGECFANSEAGEVGREATVAWKFAEGQWEGVDLAGLSAVLVIQAHGTLGSKYHSPLPVRDVLLLDAKANDAQLAALRAFVKAQLGDLAGNIVEERLVAIELKVNCCDKEGCAKLEAGDLVTIETRCLGGKDHVCGHEETYYPPLMKLAEQLPAFTLVHSVKETLLQHEWTDRDSRSAFLGKFEVRAPAAVKAVNPDEVVGR